MKSYFRILMITMLIQLVCFGINVLLVNTMPMESPLSDLGIWIFLAGFPIALIVDIVLAIRWGENLKQKLIYIFLMPTNYMGPILVAGFFLYLKWMYTQIIGM